jgi:hypothetical protein
VALTVMKRVVQSGLLLLAFSFAGCGHKQLPPQPLAAPTPLGLAEWKKLPVDLKYDEATFDRLKLADPKLQTEHGWREFMAKEIIPERKIDIPGTPGVRN